MGLCACMAWMHAPLTVLSCSARQDETGPSAGCGRRITHEVLGACVDGMASQVTGVCGWCRARDEAGGLDVEQEGQHGTGWMDGWMDEGRT